MHRPDNIDNMKQIERIMDMETCLDTAQAAVNRLADAMDQYENAADALAKLSAYYGSTLWRQDFEDDEAGRLPEDLKRGVLTEDLVYNLLTEHRDLAERMMRALNRCREDKLI